MVDAAVGRADTDTDVVPIWRWVMRGRFLDWMTAAEPTLVDDEILSGAALEVDRALGWLKAAGDLQAERWGERVARTTSRVEAMQNRFPCLGDPTRSLVVAAFVTFARSTGLRPAELAALVDIPDWLKKNLDLLQECDTLAGLRRPRRCVRPADSAGHSFRLAPRRGAAVRSKARPTHDEPRQD